MTKRLHCCKTRKPCCSTALRRIGGACRTRWIICLMNSEGASMSAQAVSNHWCTQHKTKMKLPVISLSSSIDGCPPPYNASSGTSLPTESGRENPGLDTTLWTVVERGDVKALSPLDLDIDDKCKSSRLFCDWLAANFCDTRSTIWCASESILSCFFSSKDSEV